MDRIITPGAMKRLEEDYMRETGVPGILLMEHAAQGVADAAARHAPAGSTVLFLCGPGNNGGDGYAAARLWAERGGRAVVWELTAEAKGDAAVNRRLAAEAGIPAVTLSDAVPPLPPCAAVVDALYGTGLSRPVTGVGAELIRTVNASGLPVVAVDIPSGLDGRTGEAAGEVIRAAETVTFHRIKQGLLLRDGPAFTGRLTVRPILIPEERDAADAPLCMTPADLRRVLPRRSPLSHKGMFGRTVLFCGSEGMAGAAAFCASACAKAGSGLTTALCRRAVLPVVQALAPEATCIVLPEEGGALLPGAAAVAEEALRRADRAVIGCGLGVTEDILPVMAAFRRAACPVVWDADALNLLAAHPELLPLKPEDVVTPHPGEAARLIGRTAAEVAADPLAALGALRAKTGCRVILKGAVTLMTDGIRTAYNRFGSPALAKGGSGDVLAGVTAALIGRTGAAGRDALLTEMQTAVLVHGLAGIRAAEACGEDCADPRRLIGCIRLDAEKLPPEIAP